MTGTEPRRPREAPVALAVCAAGSVIAMIIVGSQFQPPGRRLGTSFLTENCENKRPRPTSVLGTKNILHARPNVHSTTRYVQYASRGAPVETCS